MLISNIPIFPTSFEGVGGDFEMILEWIHTLNPDISRNNMFFSL